MSLSVSPPFSLQLSALSRENQRLRRQLEEERSMRRQGERLLPPPPDSQQGSSLHLPLSLSACPPPPSTSLPSSLRLPYSLSLDTATGDIDGILTQIKLSGAGLERPGESQALGEAFWNRPTASLGDARSGRTNRDLTKWSPLKTLTCRDFLTSNSSPGSVLSMRLMSCRSKSSPRELFAWGGLQYQWMMEFHQIVKIRLKNITTTTPWRHWFQEHIPIFYEFKNQHLLLLS